MINKDEIYKDLFAKLRNNKERMVIINEATIMLEQYIVINIIFYRNFRINKIEE